VRANGAQSTLLNLTVRGRDGLSLAMKSWQFEAWTRRFERVFVCDTRRPDRPCPEGLDGIE